MLELMLAIVDCRNHHGEQEDDGEDDQSLAKCDLI